MSELTEAQVDDKGRPHVGTMNADECSRETLLIMRAVGDALSELSANPMLAALMPKGFKL